MSTAGLELESLAKEIFTIASVSTGISGQRKTGVGGMTTLLNCGIVTAAVPETVTTPTIAVVAT